MTHDPKAEAAALDWVIRQRDPAFADWEAFAGWLAEAPTHGEAYHALAALDADLAGLPAGAEAVRSGSEPGNDNAAPPEPRRAARRRWLAGALAASLVAATSVGLFTRASDSYRIETAPGETQLVSLADGSRIAVNGGSSVLLSRADPRKATLERGQALFTVIHRDDAPFRVDVGPAQLVDIGTVFDVTRAGDSTRIAVSEGAVIYDPRRSNVRVDAGYRLSVRDGGPAQVRPVSPAVVGGWWSGQLVYDGVPLGEVAADVERTTGIRIRTSPGAAAVLFRGAIQTGTDESRLVGDLAVLSDTRATQDARGWTLSR